MATIHSSDYILSNKDIFKDFFSSFEHPLKEASKRLVMVSEYANKQMNQLSTLLKKDTCVDALYATAYQKLIASISLDSSQAFFEQAIRQFRNQHLLRILLREIAHLSTTQDTLANWSDCADTLITHTLLYCEHQLESRYGKPIEQSGNQARLYVIAMGKLGGQELNFSSDIDLIFAYSAVGFTNGEVQISNQQFYSKVIQLFVHLMQTKTADGFVFRVDLRLRPNGDSGPLVCNLAMMETYYQEQGRDWERYAMVKARIITQESMDSEDKIFRIIKPFVYRRHVDFSVIESLRCMKSMIAREIELNPMLDDIKRGKGGIREVEFIIQSFQLIRGGRFPGIQVQNAIQALEALNEEKLLAHTSALQQAYLFLRKLENTLQSYNDQQTHSLPTNIDTQHKISLAMEFISWEDLIKKLDKFRRIISYAFNGILNKTPDYEDNKRVLTLQLINLWQSQIDIGLAEHLLTSIGFQNASRCYQMINEFKHSPRCRRLNQTARLRLDKFMVVLLVELSYLKDVIMDKKTDEVLLEFIRLLENIVGRSAYLALLTENPQALQELLHWFIYSPFITTMIVNQPFLLEVFVDQQQDWQPLNCSRLKQILQSELANCIEPGMDDEVLRRFKLTCWLLAARAELYRQYDAVKIGKFLTNVAEVIIGEVVIRSIDKLYLRHPRIKKIKSHFAVVAYGKLGSREMNYDSDLDLVFLHTVSDNEENLVTRLTQKILHMLTTRTQSGVLYTVDTRLRPSGSAGLLVSRMDSFVTYQLNQAWTWEHQALLKARMIFANNGIKTKFSQLKYDVLFLPVDIKVLREDIQIMRKKMIKHPKNESIKHSAGGLIDLEFLVQFLVLAYPCKNIHHCTNTRLLLKILFENNILSKIQFLHLKQAYTHFHHVLHRQILESIEYKAIESDKNQHNVLAISQLFL